MKEGLKITELERLCELMCENSDPLWPLFDRNSSVYFAPEIVQLEGPENETLYIAPTGIRRFLNAISADAAPICAMIRPNSIPIVRKITTTGQLGVGDRITLSRECPVFLDFYDVLINKVSQKKWPPELMPLIFRLIEISMKPFTEEFKHDIDNNFQSPYSSTLTEMYATGYCYPKHPLKRKLLNYKLVDKEGKGCNKNSKTKGNTGPGTFAIFCLKHNKCIGFHLLTHSESPYTVFEVLLTRFQKPPKVIVYDNGCNLLTYALKREPYFFKDSHIVIDGLHFADHKNCSDVFDIRMYSQYDEFNSSLCEQKNSKLSKIKGWLMYMNAENFLTFLNYYLWWLNRKE